MARPQISINESEIDEIISLKIQELGGMKSKLTYNNVWNFNKELVNTKVNRSDGEAFSLYGYTFWASEYKGKDYYGKMKIDEIKASQKVILAGESFETDFEDILIMVDKLHKNPSELSRKLIKLFEQDRNKSKSLKEQNDKLNSEVVKLRIKIDMLEKGFANMFFNSIYENNSLNDIMSLKRTGDLYVFDELKNMFNQDEDKLTKILNNQSQLSHDKNDNTVINMYNKVKARAKLESEGL